MAAQWANEAMRLFVEEVEAGRTNVLLVRAAADFAKRVQASEAVLAKEGLDRKLLECFGKRLDAAP